MVPRLDRLRGPAKQGHSGRYDPPQLSRQGGSGDGANANPNGVNAGGNIRGITNSLGKGGDRPNTDGIRGQAIELEMMHGGIGIKSRNAD